MRVRYVCEACGDEVAELVAEAAFKAQRSLLALAPAERADLVRRAPDGTLQVSVLCDRCSPPPSLH